MEKNKSNIFSVLLTFYMHVFLSVFYHRVLNLLTNLSMAQTSKKQVHIQESRTKQLWHTSLYWGWKMDPGTARKVLGRFKTERWMKSKRVSQCLECLTVCSVSLLITVAHSSTIRFINQEEDGSYGDETMTLQAVREVRDDLHHITATLNFWTRERNGYK